MTEAEHAAFRFGLGPAPGEVAAIGSDPRGWLAEQLTPDQPLPAPLRDLESTTERMVLQLESRRDEAKKEQIRDILRQDGVRHIAAAIDSSRPFVERLSRFWLNHFTVSAVRPPVRGLALPFEVDAIRPHLFGRFADLLIAVTRHPAMLYYLDNVNSIGPNSRVGKRRSRGLNENLGREVLELHSLGVDGGYTQDDVRSMALILTGWAIANLKADNPGHFFFDERRHEPGHKILLGRRFPEAGEQEGLAALELLAAHPATARHLATKLARQFIADEPPDAAVERLSQVYLESEGNLAAVYRALIELDAAWQDPLAKVKTPQELIIAAYRGAGRKPPDRPTIGMLRRFGQLPFMAPSPAGWPDDAASWIGPEAMLTRIDWAYAVADDLDERIAPDAMLRTAVGSFASPDLKSAVARAGSRREALAYVLASPAFQRR